MPVTALRFPRLLQGVAISDILLQGRRSPQWAQPFQRRLLFSGRPHQSEAQGEKAADSKLPFVIRPQDVPAYSPANHTGTVNRRMIAPFTVGSQSIELLHGTLDATGKHKARASPHMHPDIDQVCYVLSGRALARTLTPGEDVWREEIIEKGDAVFFSKGVVHEVITLGGDEVLRDGRGSKEGEGKFQILVMYSPPYLEEAKTKTVVYNGKLD